MFDPVTAAELAAHLASQALLVVNYIAKVRNAHTRLQQLRAQLRIVLQLAEYIEKIPKDRNLMPTASLHQAMTEFRAILDELAHRIQVGGALQRLMWPLNEAETDKYFRDVEHYKTTFMSFFVMHNV